MTSIENDQADDGEELTTDELPPGTQLSNGTYTIQQHLKTGGFGITYLAADTLGRRVVIKECFPSGMCSRASRVVHVRSRAYAPSVSGLIAKFVMEAHSLAKLDHPNIVSVHQVFKENETAYMALDYVEGQDLLETMQTSAQALTPAGVQETLVKLLDAIALVHEKGLLHRDISPDNILIDAKRNPILIDFGAAREQIRTKESAASTLHVVKDGYSPQELYLAGGGDQGPWSDLYALAATFYHVVTGAAPPNAQTRLAAMASNVDDPCEPLAGRIEGYDPAFLAAIDKAMAVLPKERMQSARQWLAAIGGGSEGAAVPPRPVSQAVRPTITPMTRVTRTEAEAARKPIGPIAIISGVAALALVAVGVTLAMPESGTATVARKPAELAAAEPVAEPAPPPSAAPSADLAPAQPAEASALRADVSALTSNWTIELPFAATEAEPDRVTRTSGAVPDWLTPGLRITGVNGTPVARIDEIPELLRQSQSPEEAPSLSVTLTTQAEGEAAPVERTIDLPVVHRVVLVSGAQFLVRFKDGVWQNEVLTLPNSYSGEMRVGDLVMGHVTSGRRLDTPQALKEVLEEAIISGSGGTTLAVQQGGQMWVVTFPLPK